VRKASGLVKIGMLGWLLACSNISFSQQPAASPDTKVEAEADFRVITVNACRLLALNSS
jgi:hypothetical protein